MKTHRTTLIDKVRVLEKDVLDREGFKKALEEKILKLETDLTKSNLTFKKYEASASTVEKVCLNQKHASDNHGIGYEAKPTISKQHQNSKHIKFIPDERYNHSYFVPIYHYCGIKCHIKPKYHKLYGLPVEYVKTRNF